MFDTPLYVLVVVQAVLDSIISEDPSIGAAILVSMQIFGCFSEQMCLNTGSNMTKLVTKLVKNFIRI